MSTFEDESTKNIIGNLLNASESEPVITQEHEGARATCDESTRDRNRKRTEKGQEFWLETLRNHRDAAYRRISKRIQKICSSLENIKEVEILTQEIEELDLLKEDLNQAFNDFHDLVESEENKTASYRWFDLRDREYNECRMKISSRIHAIERGSFKEPPVKPSSQSSYRTSSTGSSHSSRLPARSRKIKAAARAAKLEAQMEFLDKEAELKKVTMMKELAMAKAERDAMKTFEDEDNQCHKMIQDPNLSCQAQINLNQDAPPFIPKETFTPFTPQGPDLPLKNNLQDVSPLNPLMLPPSEPSGPPLKSEPKMHDSLNPFNPSTPEGSQIPFKTEQQPTGLANTHVSSAVESPFQIANSSPSEVALQEIIRLQAKQTELSSLIAEQQRISSLPIQEPPTFSGNYFDYPVFMRAFETIIETSSCRIEKGSIS